MDRRVVEQRSRGGQRLPWAAATARESQALGRELVEERIVLDEALGVPQDGVRLVGAQQRPEQVARRCQRHRGALAVALRLGGEASVQVLRLGCPSGARQRPRERQPRGEAAARLQRRARQSLGQRRVLRRHGLPGRPLEQLAVAGDARLEPPDGDPQQVAAAAGGVRLDRVRQPRVDRLDARRRQPRAHRLAVQRVGDVDEPPAALGAPLHELAALERLQRAELARFEQCELERRADRHQLQHAPSARAGVLDPQIDELREPRACPDVAAPAPHAAVLGQQAVIDAVTRQLAQEQRVAARQLPQRVHAAAVDRPAQPGGEQRLDLAA